MTSEYPSTPATPSEPAGPRPINTTLNVIKGKAAEFTAASFFLRSGRVPCWPAVDHGYDFALDDGDGTFTRVQVKYASWKAAGKDRQMLQAMHTDRANYDLLVVISEDGEMWNIPSAETANLTGVTIAT